MAAFFISGRQNVTLVQKWRACLFIHIKSEGYCLFIMLIIKLILYPHILYRNHL